MAFTLDGLNREDERVGYFPYAPGVDRTGNECMMVIHNDTHASGCNPMYWDASPYNRYGEAFASREDAEYQAKYARGSWSVKSVDTDNIKIGIVKFHTVIKAVNWDDVA